MPRSQVRKRDVPNPIKTRNTDNSVGPIGKGLLGWGWSAASEVGEEARGGGGKGRLLILADGKYRGGIEAGVMANAEAEATTGTVAGKR